MGLQSQTWLKWSSIHAHVCVSIYMHINMMEHVHWVKDKNCTIISIICKKIDKIQHPFMTKTLQKLGIERMYLSIIKAIYDKFTADIIWWNLESVSFKIRKKKGVSTLTTSIQQVPEVLARAIGKNKRHPNQRGWSKIPFACRWYNLTYRTT